MQCAIDKRIAVNDLSNLCVVWLENHLLLLKMLFVFFVIVVVVEVSRGMASPRRSNFREYYRYEEGRAQFQTHMLKLSLSNVILYTI